MKLKRTTRVQSQPPGFRFHPTDEELFMFYLKRKVLGKSICPQMISDVDVYLFEPWDLPSKSVPRFKDLNWYFFCPRSKKYANGGRRNRSTECGCWKSTGNDRTVQFRNRPVGKIKTLIFYLGKPPRGERTNWVMHEYRLNDKLLADKGIPQDAYVICKVYEKSGVGPKNGEHHGAPFVEEEWEGDESDDDVSHPEGFGFGFGFGVADNHNGCLIVNNILNTQTFDAKKVVVASDLPTPAVQQAVETAPLSAIEDEDDELHKLLSLFTEDETFELNRLSSIFTKDETPINGVNDNEDNGFMELDDLV